MQDLDALAEAAESCGCELVRDQKTFRWYGRHMGDYPLPASFTKDDMGKCDHAIKVKNGNGSEYEVGVTARRDGKPGYTLLWDFWQKGYGLQERIGKDGSALRQQYAAKVATKTLKRQGYRVASTTTQDGKLRLRFTK